MGPVVDWLQWERYIHRPSTTPFIVYNVRAFDSGRDEDVGIRYSLLEEGDYEYFNIDSNTGVVSLSKLAPPDKSVYRISIWIRDEIGNWTIQSGKVIIAE